LILVVSKVVECIIKKQLETFFEKQFGFRSNLSTIKALESIVTYVLNSFEKRKRQVPVC
jgi:hypothetical protein